MTNRDHVLALAQDCLRRVPTILLGSGASAAHGVPGMPALADHLKAAGLPSMTSTADTACWQLFVAGLDTKDLEACLMEVQVTPLVLAHIVNETWRFLNRADLSVFQKVITDRRSLALTLLFEHLFRSTVTEINVVTPNYDRIAEYAAEAAGFMSYTGFGYGLIAARAGRSAPRVYVGAKPARTVNVWKVHGSFGWFVDPLGVVTSLPPVQVPPPGFQPAIVTPGIEKFRRTHDEPFRSVMQMADDAIRGATGFLCVGFGFNDPHLQTLLAERCASPDVPLVLLTKGISESAQAFLNSGRCKRYLALEQNEGGTRAFCNESPAGIELPGTGMWQLRAFLEEVT